jgi:hypothetical protein
MARSRELNLSIRGDKENITFFCLLTIQNGVYLNLTLPCHDKEDGWTGCWWHDDHFTRREQAAVDLKLIGRRCVASHIWLHRHPSQYLRENLHTGDSMIRVLTDNISLVSRLD